MATTIERPSRIRCLSPSRFSPKIRSRMSCVNMLERARNCESSDIVADTIPTPRKPATTGFVSFFTRMPRTCWGLQGERVDDRLAVGRTAVEAQMPKRMQGAQTSMMKIGCRITTVRKVLTSLAVIQCWKRCGNMPTESGTNM